MPTEVPVTVRVLTDQQVAEIMMEENIRRENLNPVEEAQGFRRAYLLLWVHRGPGG